LRGQLRRERRRAEYPHLLPESGCRYTILGSLPRARDGMDILVRMPGGELVGKEAEQLENLLGEPVIGVCAAAQCLGSGPVCAGSPPEPEVDPVRGESRQHPELLGDDKWCMVRKHDSARPESDVRGLGDET